MPCAEMVLPPVRHFMGKRRTDGIRAACSELGGVQPKLVGDLGRVAGAVMTKDTCRWTWKLGGRNRDAVVC